MKNANRQVKLNTITMFQPVPLSILSPVILILSNKASSPERPKLYPT